MIEEKARVVVVGDGFVWVETERRGACGQCAVNRGCGTAALARVLGRRRVRVRALDPLGVRQGEEVVIGIRENALVRGSLAVYLLPIVFMIAGGLAGQAFAADLEPAARELGSVLSGIGGLAAGFLWLRRFAAAIRTDARYQPVVLRRAAPGGGVLGRASHPLARL